MIPNWLTSGKIEPFLLPAAVVLVALGAFGLGRLSAGPGHQALRILYPNAQDAVPLANTAALANAAQVGAGQTQGTPAGTQSYVASKSGTKYYLVSCAGAARIKSDNRMYFASAAQAQAAGYGPAANCPGL